MPEISKDVALWIVLICGGINIVYAGMITIKAAIQKFWDIFFVIKRNRMSAARFYHACELLREEELSEELDHNIDALVGKDVYDD